jgi:hypothetical protein
MLAQLMGAMAAGIDGQSEPMTSIPTSESWMDDSILAVSRDS